MTKLSAYMDLDITQTSNYFFVFLLLFILFYFIFVFFYFFILYIFFQSELGLDHNANTCKIEELKLKNSKIVGMFCGYFHVSLLVENEKKERQIVAWGYDL